MILVAHQSNQTTKTMYHLEQFINFNPTIVGFPPPRIKKDQPLSCHRGTFPPVTLATVATLPRSELLRQHSCSVCDGLHNYATFLRLTSISNELPLGQRSTARVGGWRPNGRPRTPSWLAISSPSFTSLSMLVHYVVHVTGRSKLS